MLEACGFRGGGRDRTGRPAGVGARPSSRKRQFVSDLAKEQRRFRCASGGPCLQVTLELSQPLNGARLTHQRRDLEETRAHRLPRECHAGRMDEGTRLHTSGLRNLPQSCLGSWRRRRSRVPRMHRPAPQCVPRALLFGGASRPPTDRNPRSPARTVRAAQRSRSPS